MKNLPLLLFTFFITACSSVSALRYKEIKGFFPGNDVVDENMTVHMVFTDSSSMAKAFHPAATMGTTLTPPDFSKEFAVGIALSPGTEDRNVTIEAVEYENSTAKIFYRIQTTGKNLTYSSKPAILIAVRKGDVNHVEFLENGKKVNRFDL